MNIREEAIKRAIRYGYIDDGDILEFTCDTCFDMPTCICAYDLYNTHGDCLMEK